MVESFPLESIGLKSYTFVGATHTLHAPNKESMFVNVKFDFTSTTDYVEKRTLLRGIWLILGYPELSAKFTYEQQTSLATEMGFEPLSRFIAHVGVPCLISDSFKYRVKDIKYPKYSFTSTLKPNQPPQERLSPLEFQMVTSLHRYASSGFFTFKPL